MEKNPGSIQPFSKLHPAADSCMSFDAYLRPLAQGTPKVLKFLQSAMFNSCRRRQADLQMQAETEIWNEYSMLG
jgi:hypothetical protein